jgi:hypothetical protein
MPSPGRRGATPPTPSHCSQGWVLLPVYPGRPPLDCRPDETQLVLDSVQLDPRAHRTSAAHVKIKPALPVGTGRH